MVYLPFGYEKINSATWMFLTSLLVIGLYFKFNRFWSIRNIDLLLLIMLGPGMVLALEGRVLRDIASQAYFETYSPLVIEDSGPGNLMPSQQSPIDSPAKNTDQQLPVQVPPDSGPPDSDSLDKNSNDAADSIETNIAREKYKALATPTTSRPMSESEDFREAVWLERMGYLWLFFVGTLLTVRLLIDSGFRRRPQLEPNLSTSGLTFLGCALLGFLLLDIVKTQVQVEDKAGADRLFHLVNREAMEEGEAAHAYKQYGPGYGLLHALPAISTFASSDDSGISVNEETSFQLEFIAKLMAVLCQVGIVAGLFLMAYWHLGSFNLAISITTLYLILPYTGQMSGRVFHVLPALLLVWALVFYRRPFWAGIFIGLAAGVFYYPLFLLPLWFSFYWDRGRWRFLVGLSVSIGLVVGSLVFVSRDVGDFFGQLQQIFGFWLPRFVGVSGIWSLGWNPMYRLPFLVAFVGLAVSFAFWPIRKDYGVLLSCTAATMVALQFCHGFGGGLYIAWYLPLLLMVVFRPNLEDRIALNVVRERKTKRARNPESEPTSLGSAAS